MTVRWTVNDWNTSADASATYVDNSSDGATDKFKFRVSVGCLPVGSRVQFCLRYACGGQEFWDNNGGTNYILQVCFFLQNMIFTGDGKTNVFFYAGDSL